MCTCICAPRVWGGGNGGQMTCGKAAESACVQDAIGTGAWRNRISHADGLPRSVHANTRGKLPSPTSPPPPFPSPMHRPAPSKPSPTSSSAPSATWRSRMPACCSSAPRRSGALSRSGARLSRSWGPCARRLSRYGQERGWVEGCERVRDRTCAVLYLGFMFGVTALMSHPVTLCAQTQPPFAPSPLVSPPNTVAPFPISGTAGCCC
jgi:hypothetical protein